MADGVQTLRNLRPPQSGINRQPKLTSVLQNGKCQTLTTRNERSTANDPKGPAKLVVGNRTKRCRVDSITVARDEIGTYGR
jgi:hypothetical protein